MKTLQTISKVTQYLALLMITIISIDFLAFTAWIASGQHPGTDTYIGMITAQILKIILM